MIDELAPIVAKRTSVPLTPTTEKKRKRRGGKCNRRRL